MTPAWRILELLSPQFAATVSGLAALARDGGRAAVRMWAGTLASASRLRKFARPRLEPGRGWKRRPLPHGQLV